MGRGLEARSQQEAFGKELEARLKSGTEEEPEEETPFSLPDLFRTTYTGKQLAEFRAGAVKRFAQAIDEGIGELLDYWWRAKASQRLGDKDRERENVLRDFSQKLGECKAILGKLDETRI